MPVHSLNVSVWTLTIRLWYVLSLQPVPSVYIRQCQSRTRRIAIFTSVRDGSVENSSWDHHRKQYFLVLPTWILLLLIVKGKMMVEYCKFIRSLQNCEGLFCEKNYNIYIFWNKIIIHFVALYCNIFTKHNHRFI